MVLLAWCMKVFVVSYTIRDKKPCTKLSRLWKEKLIFSATNVFHLEDTMIMFGIYNCDTLAQLIETVHRMHNTTSRQERTFVGKINQWFELYRHQYGVGHYAINSVLFLTIIREKYVKMYERFLDQLKMYCQSNKDPFKRLFAIFTLTPIKII